MSDRIVHLCYAGTGGATRVALSIAAASARPARHAYVLFGVVPPRPEHVSQLDRMGCSWRHVLKRPGPDVRGYRAAAGAVLALQPAVAMLHGWRLVPVEAMLGRSVPRVSVEHGPLTRRWMRLAAALFAAMADRSVAVSAALAEQIALDPLLARAARPWRVIPNGIDVDFWRAPPPEPPAGRPARVGMVAALAASKDHATLLRAVALLRRQGRDVRLHLVGGGPSEGPLRALAEELGIAGAVVFEGELPPPGVREVLHRLDLAVLATHGEGFGLAVAEAQAAARAVVASDVPGPRQLIEHQRTGLLAAHGDAAAHAAAIARLLDEPQLARELALAGQDSVRRRHDAAAMARAYESLADELPD